MAGQQHKVFVPNAELKCPGLVELNYWNKIITSKYIANGAQLILLCEQYGHLLN